MLQGLVRGDQPPYMVVRNVAHYAALQSNPSHPMAVLPGLGKLMALTEAALDIGGYTLERKEGWVYEHPGLIFMHLLGLWDNRVKSFPAEIGLADQLINERLGFGWRTFLTSYVRRMERSLTSVVPPHLRPEAARFYPVRAIREKALNDCLAIMRSKANDLLSWINPIEYIKTMHNLPKPPLRLAPGFARVSSSQEGANFLIWSILIDFVEGVMLGDKVECAIAKRLSPAIELFQFPDPADSRRQTNCRPFVEQGTCGSYNGKYLPGQPYSCPFAGALENLTKQGKIEVQFTGGTLG
jgi:hypothetical protein